MIERFSYDFGILYKFHFGFRKIHALLRLFLNAGKIEFIKFQVPRKTLHDRIVLTLFSLLIYLPFKRGFVGMSTRV